MKTTKNTNIFNHKTIGNFKARVKTKLINFKTIDWIWAIYVTPWSPRGHTFWGLLLSPFHRSLTYIYFSIYLLFLLCLFKIIYNIARVLALHKFYWAAMNKIFIYARPYLLAANYSSRLLSCSAVFLRKKPAKSCPIFISALTF